MRGLLLLMFLSSSSSSSSPPPWWRGMERRMAVAAVVLGMRAIIIIIVVVTVTNTTRNPSRRPNLLFEMVGILPRRLCRIIVGILLLMVVTMVAKMERQQKMCCEHVKMVGCEVVSAAYENSVDPFVSSSVHELEQVGILQFLSHPRGHLLFYYCRSRSILL